MGSHSSHSGEQNQHQELWHSHPVSLPPWRGRRADSWSGWWAQGRQSPRRNSCTGNAAIMESQGRISLMSVGLPLPRAMPFFRRNREWGVLGTVSPCHSLFLKTSVWRCQETSALYLRCWCQQNQNQTGQTPACVSKPKSSLRALATRFFPREAPQQSFCVSVFMGYFTIFTSPVFWFWHPI